MPDPDFGGIRAALLNAGIAPKYVRRALNELKTHFADLCAEAEEHGLTGDAAATYACEKIGTRDALLAAYLEQRNLRSWGARWPKTLFILAPLLSIVILMSALTVATADLLERYVATYGHGGAAVSPFVRFIVTFLPVVDEYGLPAMACLAISVYASRRRLAPLWPAVGVFVVALLAAMTLGSATLPENGQPGGTQFGVGLFPYGLEGVLVRLVLAAPFALAPYVQWRRRSGRSGR